MSPRQFQDLHIKKHAVKLLNDGTLTLLYFMSDFFNMECGFNIDHFAFNNVKMKRWGNSS